MKKIYYLKTCNTCTRFVNQIQNLASFTLHDIKAQPLTISELDALKKRAGSYETLFSRRAKLYREMGLHERNLTEADYKYYLLQHYTFLKRPVVVVDDKIFIGPGDRHLAEIHQISAP